MQIGRYTICGLLGRGGMGAVYKVRQPITGKIAALKLLRPAELMEDIIGMEELRQRFIAEAQVMASLDHPNIAAIWDVDEAKNRPFFIMEYYCLNLGMLIGESYRVEAPTRRLPLTTAVPYALQTLSALARMHHAGIIHRDIKPFNIMLTNTNEVKLIDFGLSRQRGETLPDMHGTKVGSPFYAPPEQEDQPEAVDARADLYPVGVMLYRMLTGVLPTDDIFHGNIPTASQFSTDLDSEWDHFFAHALAKSPEKRFSSAREMRHALERLLHRWENKLRNVCKTLPDSPEHTEHSLSQSPRCVPKKISPRDAPKAFAVDELWRPQQYLTPHRLIIRQDSTVSDPATGLIWQQSGSEYPMTWEEAQEYITMLNEQKFGESDTWQLPTVPQLATLLEEPPMLGDFCLPEVFDASQQNLWTCDRKSYRAAWFVCAAMGFVGWQDFTCHFHVRAVRNAKLQPS